MAKKKPRIRIKDSGLEGKAILSAIKPSITGIIPVTDADYDELRGILYQLQKVDVEY